MKEYYLYRHIRLDKNQVFYIGIGTITSESLQKKVGGTYRALHRRAYDKTKSRNQYWKNIVNKTAYEVEIMLHTNDEKFIIEKEKEFIGLYKKTLCNLTDGGLGLVSYRHTKEGKKAISRTMLGRKLTAIHKERVNVAKFKPVKMFNMYETHYFNSLSDAAIFIGDIKYLGNISSCLLGLKATAYGWKFIYAKSVESQDKELVR